MRRTAGVVVGAVLALYFSFCSWSSHGMETCTMGDTDGYLAALIFGGPALLVAMILLWRGRTSASPATYVGPLLVGAASGALLFLDLLPWAASTTFAGNHPCGAEYNSYLPYLGAFRYYLPAIHAALSATLLVFAAFLLLGAMRRAA